MAMTLRQTYSSILSWNCLNMAITLVIFSTIFPTSWRNWSIVIGFPIILVKHVCNVTKLVATWEIKIVCMRMKCWEWRKTVASFYLCILSILPLGEVQPSLHQFLWSPSSSFRGWLGRQRWLRPTTRATCVSKALYEHLPKDPYKKEVFASIELICTLWNHQFDRVCFASRLCSDLIAPQCSKS